MTSYKGELESSLKKVGNQYKPKLKQLHLTKEQVTELYNSINFNKFSGVTIFIGDKLK